MSRGKRAVAMLSLLSVFVLPGCDPLTRNRFDMIVVDKATKMDVEQTIGKATYQLPGTWHYERPARHLNAMIDFDAEGMVTRKQWIDTERGQWNDTKQPHDADAYESTTIRNRR